MSDSAPAVTPGRPSEPVVYRPLSGLAVASFILAVLYASGLLILAGVALYVKAPVFLDAWTFAVPFAALVLATVARQRIRRSEGTRVGLALANWAWWLGLLTGLGYGAFCFGTYLAVVRLQAEPYARAWLDQLHQGKLNQAFLETRPPAQRSGNPDDPQTMYIRYALPGPKGRPGPLITFKEHEIIRMVHQGGPGLIIQPLGVRDWGYKEGGYYVEQAYRITTPEGTFELPLRVRSSQDQRGRQWQVVWDDRIGWLHATPTLLGRTVESWRLQAPLFVHEWLAKRDRGELPMDADAWQTPDKKMRDQLLADVKKDFRNAQALRIRPSREVAHPRRLDEQQGQLEVGVDLELQEVADDKVLYQAAGVLVLESQPGSLTPERAPGWRVVRLELLRGGSSAAPQQERGPILPFGDESTP